MFRRAVLKDPLRMKALAKGLAQLCEEGATQLFRPLRNAELILGAVGQLQFEVVAFRLADEYAVQCVFEAVTVHTHAGSAAWTSASWRNSRSRRTTTWHAITVARWCIWPYAGQPAADDRALAGAALQRDTGASRPCRPLKRQVRTTSVRAGVHGAPGH